jgi:hypothetical protein
MGYVSCYEEYQASFETFGVGMCVAREEIVQKVTGVKDSQRRTTSVKVYYIELVKNLNSDTLVKVLPCL